MGLFRKFSIVILCTKFLTPPGWYYFAFESKSMISLQKGMDKIDLVVRPDPLQSEGWNWKSR